MPPEVSRKEAGVARGKLVCAYKEPVRALIYPAHLFCIFGYLLRCNTPCVTLTVEPFLKAHSGLSVSGKVPGYSGKKVPFRSGRY